MKAILICPAERPGVSAIAESAPLAIFSIFGKELICHWIEYLAHKGAKEILISAADRPEKIRAVVGDGSRWGVKAEVFAETRELSTEEARKKYRLQESGWIEAPHDVTLMETLPLWPETKLFSSYASLFAVLSKSFQKAATRDRIGLREISSGVWAGLGAQISSDAKLLPPCWISDHACIGSNAVVGPFAIVESRVVVDANATISHSVIAPDTFIGKFISVENSFAIGSTLVNWQTNSQTKVVDPFLLAPLNWPVPRLRNGNMIGSIAALFALLGTSPLAIAWLTAAGLRGGKIFHKRKAVCPHNPSSTIDYYEFANTNGFWRRWPQLWNVVRGEFAWVGNRPLTTHQAAELQTDFERLWLAAPVGLLSQADAFGCMDEFSDEARAHAAFYSAQQNWKLSFSILARVLRQLCLPKKAHPATAPAPVLQPKTVPITQSISR